MSNGAQVQQGRLFCAWEKGRWRVGHSDRHGSHPNRVQYMSLSRCRWRLGEGWRQRPRCGRLNECRRALHTQNRAPAVPRARRRHSGRSEQHNDPASSRRSGRVCYSRKGIEMDRSGRKQTEMESQKPRRAIRKGKAGSQLMDILAPSTEPAARGKSFKSRPRVSRQPVLAAANLFSLAPTTARTPPSGAGAEIADAHPHHTVHRQSMDHGPRRRPHCHCCYNRRLSVVRGARHDSHGGPGRRIPLLAGCAATLRAISPPHGTPWAEG